MANNLLIPLNAKILGQPVSEYKADEKAKPIIRRPAIQPANSFGNVIPLIGADGKKEFTVMEALAEAQKQHKVLVHLSDADAYVLKNGGSFWIGEAILYPGPKDKFSSKLTYNDYTGVNYQAIIPSQFQSETGSKAIRLSHGYDSEGNPFFEFKQGENDLWTLQFNQPDNLISSGLLHTAKINRKNDWYATDADKFPNGAKSDDKNQDARYFWQIDGGRYISLLARSLDDGGNHRGVNAIERPSCHLGVLVYE